MARTLVEEVFCRYGTPLELLSDRGGEVDGQVMRELCQLLQIDKLRTSSYHPLAMPPVKGCTARLIFCWAKLSAKDKTIGMNTCRM